MNLKGKTLTLIFCLCLLIGYGQENDSAVIKIQSRKEIRRAKKNLKNEVKQAEPSADLNDPVFIDYTEATIFLSPLDSLTESAFLRKNYTDQFLSVWENARRIYPASMIYGFIQDGKYYRSCKFNSRNSVYGEQIVNGSMNLFYCRKIPQEAGFIEFVSADPNNPGYRNFQIITDYNRARFENDYYYFVTLDSDSLTAIPISDFESFSRNYLTQSPEAYRLMMKFGKKKTLVQKIVAPAIVGVMGIAVLLSGSIEEGLLISTPVIAGGMVYYLVKRRKAPARPDPVEMSRIIRIYNSTVR